MLHIPYVPSLTPCYPSVPHTGVSGGRSDDWIRCGGNPAFCDTKWVFDIRSAPRCA